MPDGNMHQLTVQYKSICPGRISVPNIVPSISWTFLTMASSNVSPYLVYPNGKEAYLLDRWLCFGNDFVVFVINKHDHTVRVTIKPKCLHFSVNRTRTPFQFYSVMRTVFVVYSGYSIDEIQCACRLTVF